jgi:8-oxo-dGTP pyrophosphatase MutT (NUDIX family)
MKASATLDQVRRALKRRLGKVLHAGTYTSSSILVPLLEREGELHVLLTRRTETVRDHKSQISFPGGVRDEADESLLDTALREMYEELGVNPLDVEILGKLDDLYTITGYCIAPYVGAIPWPYQLTMNKEEIAEILVLPVASFMDPAVFREELQECRGRRHAICYFDVRPDITVWGATGRILSQLLRTCCKWKKPFGSGDSGTIVISAPGEIPKARGGLDRPVEASDPCGDIPV